MKIVVTGALGHIGSKVIKELPASLQVNEMVMIDNMSTQRYPSLFDLPSGTTYRFFEEDVMTCDLESIFDGVDVVIHLAAITNAAGSFEIKQKVEYENFNATKRVADACLKTDSALIHLSSTSVYGTQAEVVDENCSEEELAPQ
ncbi:MAG: NAD(P)-dependent oxidoreductase, partial [Cytophagales bacterium]|nr:NAD(P)-dependent oxidoreductase [Cytophagales bacterium]